MKVVRLGCCYKQDMPEIRHVLVAIWCLVANHSLWTSQFLGIPRDSWIIIPNYQPHLGPICFCRSQSFPLAWSLNINSLAVAGHRTGWNFFPCSLEVENEIPFTRGDTFFRNHAQFSFHLQLFQVKQEPTHPKRIHYITKKTTKNLLTFQWKIWTSSPNQR